jgi:sulfoxide reductase heme-binding subunit YedZ
MSDDLATTTSPRGLRRRLVRHYVPLALAGTAALALFMNLSFFDANRYPPPEDIFAEGAKGALPDGDYPPEGSSDRSQHAGGAPGGQQHDGATPTTVPSSPGVPGGPGGSGGAHTGPPAGGHGGGQTGPPTTQPDKGQAGATPTEPRHAGNQDSVLLMRRYSTATGYVATALLALTLLIGPANLVLRRRNPISGYFRRDVGIWTAITSVVHVVFGFLVKHGDGQVLGYFFQPGDRTRVLTNSFGLANWAGLAAVLIVAGLAVISSDAALRKLRARRWKRLQRLNYALFALVVFHAMAYGALWRTTSPYTVLLALTLTGVITAQAIGVRLWRQRHNPAPAIA